MSVKTGESKFTQLVVTIFFILLTAIVLVPFMYLLSLSVSDYKDLYDILLFPKTIKLENYAEAWRVANIQDFFMNSLVITIASVCINVIASSMAAYAIARFTFPLKEVIFYMFLLVLILPGVASLVPLFLELKVFGLLNTRLGLILTYSSMQLAISIFILRSFFETLPRELEEAALMDGAGSLIIFVRVMLPISKPSLLTVVIFNFVFFWQELIMAITFLSSDAKKTLPAGLINLKSEFYTDYPVLAAGLVISIIPILVLYASLQKYIESGLTLGAVKQ